MPSAISHLLHSHPLPNPNLPLSSQLFFHPTTPRRCGVHSNRHHHHHHHHTFLRHPPRAPSVSLRRLGSPPEPDEPADLCGNVLSAVKKPLSMALFFVAVASAPLLLPPRARAIAVPPTLSVATTTPGTPGLSSAFEHEFSSYTQRLLEAVASLLHEIEDAKSHPGGPERVASALKEVKSKRKELHKEVLDALKAERRKLRSQQAGLLQRSIEVWKERWKLSSRLCNAVEEREVLLDRRKGILERRGGVDNLEEQRGQLGSLEENLKKIDTLDKEVNKLKREVDAVEEVYWEMLEKVEDIDKEVLWREMLTYTVATRELVSVEKESEFLVERFKKMPKKKEGQESWGQSFSSRMSKDDIQKELEAARRDHLEQSILPQVMETEDSELFADHNTWQFILNIKNAFKVSGDLQRNLEARIRRKYKRYGVEKRFLVKTPDDEVLKGFPEAELKWMFGQKEVIVPKASHLHLLHGWKKWREEAKANLKRQLIKNVDDGKSYIRQRQENLLLDRDRLVAKTWYNDEKKRWEIDPVAVPFAISKKLVEHARIRDDWAVMYLAIKGDEKEYFVDIKEFDFLFKDFGGFDGLYMKLMASGTPTSVHFMWIPLSDVDCIQQFRLLMRLSYKLAVGFWNSWIVTYIKNSIYKRTKKVLDAWMVLVGFPLLNTLIPYPIRVSLGMALPYVGKQVGTLSWYLKWQLQAKITPQRNRNIYWWSWLLLRSFVCYYVLFQVLRFMRRRITYLGWYRADPNLRKLQRVKTYYKFLVDKCIQPQKERLDPIRSLFDQMKRVKNPPICLDDFAGVDSMREEINEIVAFLQNPAAFQEIGARAPRGVLIVGEAATGKTSLALAIAAEAKVPLVEVQSEQLESGTWVGQSAANVRELFQAARDLAPVIIFIEDFDSFSGIRGQYVHTEFQDHEAVINQFLVELDGFENQKGVVLLATATDLRQIDEALKRPGRMDRVLHLQSLTQLEREKILRMAAKETMDEDLIDYVDWGKVAEKTNLLRAVDLKHVPISLEGSAFRNKFLDADELLTYCGWFAAFSNCIPDWLRQTPFAKKISKRMVKHLGLELNREDLQMVVDLMEPYGCISNGIELFSPPTDWSRETKLPHAVWAAGRGLIVLLLPNFDIVDHIWLQPHSWEGIGCTKITKAKSEGSSYENAETRSYLEKKLVFCFGSYVASQMLLPLDEETFISEAELKEAQEIATRMVIQYGWGPDDSPIVYFDSKAAPLLSMGDELEDEMGAKVEKIYNLAYEKAKDMLAKNHKVLEEIVENLLEFESLSGEDLLKILHGHGGIQEKEPFLLTVRRKEVAFAGFLNDGNGSGVTLAMM